MYWINFNTKTKAYNLTKNNEEIVSGDLNKVSCMALKEGISSEELEFAYNHMNNEKHTKAHFGLVGHFIYSK